MIKKNYALALAALMAAVPAGATFANEDGDASADKSSMSSADYWTAKKAEMGKKAAAMRAAKVEAMKAQGYDLSDMPAEFLDPSLQDESKFWDYLKGKMGAKAAEKRQKLVDELKAQGYDVSTITPEMLDPANHDESGFWKAVKAIKEGSKPQDTPESRQAQVDYMKAKGLDVSAFTPEVMADPAQFQAAVEAAKKAWFAAQGQKGDEGRPEKPGKGSRGDGQGRPPRPEGKDRPEGQGPRGGEGADRPEPRDGSGSQDRPAPAQRPGKPQLTPELRKGLEAKLRAIPDDKKAAAYQNLKTLLTAKIEAAKAAGKDRLAALLTEALGVVEDVLNPDVQEGQSELDSLIQQAAQ